MASVADCSSCMKPFVAVALVVCVWGVACQRGGRTQGAGQPVAATNAKIDLELSDVPIDDALRALAKQARINLSVDPDVTGSVSISVRAAPWQHILDAVVREHALQVIPIEVGNGRTVFRVANASTPPSPVTRFTGAPIDVSFDEVPIRTVAKTLSDFAGVSIVVDDDVQVDVTQWSRQVPWDFVLDHVVRKYELRAIRNGNEIRITKRP